MSCKSNVSAAKKLEKTYGKDLLDLEKCYKIRDQYKTEIKDLEKRLDLSDDANEINASLNKATNMIKRIDDITMQSDVATNEVTEYLQEVNEVKETLRNYMFRSNMVDSIQQYMKVLKCVESLSNDLQKNVDQNDDEQCTTAFANITEIARHLVSTPAIHLREYLKFTVDSWHDILKLKFSNDLNQILTIIKWPFINNNKFNEDSLNDSLVTKLHSTVESLLQIDLPEELVPPPQGLFSGVHRVSLPIQLLIEPLKKRFLFHFYGSRKTNRIDKPEWYFTKILTWIKDHAEFVEKYIQPIIDKIGLCYIDAKVELMRGLVQLAIEKLNYDLPNLQYDEYMFSHCIDEALGFDKELKITYNYPITQPNIFLVLTQASIFVNWLAMEKKFALEKMDVMLSDTPNDYVLMPPTENEDFKIMPAGEIFVTLLQTITERYESLPQPGHRLQFLDLQLELLDDFRVRLLQLVSTEDTDNCRIAITANTTFYIENVLVDWGQMLHFLNLYYYKNQAIIPDSRKFNYSEVDNFLTDIDTDTVFNEVLSLYRHVKKDLLFTLVDFIIIKIKYRSKNYLTDNWSQMEKVKDMRSHSLTPTACPMFEILSATLHDLEKYLTLRLFTIVWRLVAKQLDIFLYEKLILANKFNEGGAEQLKFDVLRNLLPLFAQYTDKPDSYCTYLKDACTLLALTKGSALLLKDTLVSLEGATGVEDKRGPTLKEIGILTLQPNDALNVLNQRTDMRLYQMPSFD